MCHLLSHTYGYICVECFNELVRRGPSANISLFMGTRKQKRLDFDLEEMAFNRFSAEFSDGG